MCFAPEAFFIEGAQPTRLKGFRFDVLLSDDAPVASKPFLSAPDRRASVAHHIKKHLAAGNIVRAGSPYAAAGFAIKEKGKEFGRFVVDYRRLNDKTIRSHAPIPDIWSILQGMAGSNFLTALDLNAGFHHLLLTLAAQEKLAFVVPEGQFRWLTLPMGPSNGPPSFQEAMSIICNSIVSSRGGAAIFIDDLAIRT